MLPIAIEPSAVSAAGCFSRRVVYTREPATIRDSPQSSGAVVRYTLVGEGLVIIHSKRANSSCWLQTNQGWLIYDPLVISDTFSGAKKEATGAGQPPCLKGETATITGPMNIRESPTTSSPVVTSAQAGDTFTVTQKTVGVKWCWLKISLGWLADTERVRVTIPNRFVDTGSTAPTTTPPSDIDNCCFVDRQCTTEQEWIDGYWARQNGHCGAQPPFSVTHASRPRIEGSEAFIHLVTESLNLMEHKAPALYIYIVSVTSVIEEHAPDHIACGLAYVGTGRTSLGSCVKEEGMPGALYGVAGVLAHEACHHHGDDIDPETGEFDHEPCFQATIDARAALTAGTPYR